MIYGSNRDEISAIRMINGQKIAYSPANLSLFRRAKGRKRGDTRRAVPVTDVARFNTSVETINATTTESREPEFYARTARKSATAFMAW